MVDQFASSEVSNGCHLAALVEAKFATKGLTNKGTRADILPGRNEKGTRKFSGKKITMRGCPKIIFETNFQKLSVPFDYEPLFPEILVEWNAPKVTAGGNSQRPKIWTESVNSR